MICRKLVVALTLIYFFQSVDKIQFVLIFIEKLYLHPLLLPCYLSSSLKSILQNIPYMKKVATIISILTRNIAYLFFPFFL